MNKLITSQWTSNRSPAASSGTQTPKEGVNRELSNLPKLEGAENPAKRKAVKSRDSDKKRQKGRNLFGCWLMVVSDWAPPTSVNLEDLGGIEDCIQEVVELIVWPLKYPGLYSQTGIQPPRFHPFSTH